MATHDYNIANDTGAAVRSDLNNALSAIVTQNSNATAPSTTFPRMFWLDTSTNLRKRRNAANSAWIIDDTIAESFVISRVGNAEIGVSDFGKTFVATASFTQTFASTSALGDGWHCFYRNSSSGVVTLDPSTTELMDGVQTIGLSPGESVRIACNGAQFFTTGRSVLPVGSMVDFGGTVAPSGWLGCDGSAVSRTTYAALFAAIGETWGPGNGSTTFNLPDFRRRVAVGSGGASSGDLGNTVGSTGGEEGHFLTIAEMPAHTHGITNTFSSNDAQSRFGSMLTGGFNNSGDPTQGGGLSHNNMQPSAVVLKIIKT